MMVPARTTATAAKTIGSRARRRRAPWRTGSPGIGTGGTGGSRRLLRRPAGAGPTAVPSSSPRRTRLGTGGVSPPEASPPSPAAAADPPPAVGTGPGAGAEGFPVPSGAPRPPTTTVAHVQGPAPRRPGSTVPAAPGWAWPAWTCWPAATWRSRGRSCAGVARPAGSLASSRARTGARGPRRWGGRGCPATMAFRVWNSPPPKGGWPSTANQRVAPSAHRSVAGLTSWASTCSGAM
jgi:hypothetical protein